jgi:hypothetical protein
MAEQLTEMDAFELRYQLVYGMHPSDGLVVHVVDESTLMIVGTDSTAHPKHGLHLATGRTLNMWRGAGGWLVGSPQRVPSGHVAKTLTDLDVDLAWVRRRTDP